MTDSSDDDLDPTFAPTLNPRADQTIDIGQEYNGYIARFEEEHPRSQLGAFVKRNGRLIKKLSFEEFSPKFIEYGDIKQTYLESLDRGDTVNDVVVKVVREFAVELFLEPPF